MRHTAKRGLPDVLGAAERVARASGRRLERRVDENIGITDTYLQGLGVDVALNEVYAQPIPTVPATELLALAAPPARRELVSG